MEGPDYSMLFDDNSKIHDLSGIIPRAAEFIFQEIDRIKTQFKREFRIEISSMEIYCENLRDLYADSNSNGDNPNNLNLVSIKNRIVVQG